MCNLPFNIRIFFRNKYNNNNTTRVKVIQSNARTTRNQKMLKTIAERRNCTILNTLFSRSLESPILTSSTPVATFSTTFNAQLSITLSINLQKSNEKVREPSLEITRRYIPGETDSPKSFFTAQFVWYCTALIVNWEREREREREWERRIYIYIYTLERSGGRIRNAFRFSSRRDIGGTETRTPDGTGGEGFSACRLVSLLPTSARM